MSSQAILVIGAGDYTGGAVARRFAREGFVACVTRRNADKLAPLVELIRAEGGQAHAFGSDARREEQVAELFGRIERDIGPIEVCVYNVGGNVRFPILETTSRVYFKVWEMCAMYAFLAKARGGEIQAPRLRGKPSCSPAPRLACAAAPAMPPSRAASTQSERSPSRWRANSAPGIHVAHVVIDSGTPPSSAKTGPTSTGATWRTRSSPRRRRDLLADPQAPRTAWTFETDLRPGRRRGEVSDPATASPPPAAGSVTAPYRS